MDITEIPILGKFFSWRYNRAILQFFLLLVSAVILFDGFFGPQIAPKNLAGSLPWVHWRGFVVLALLIFGNLFCMACPFMFVRKLSKKLLPGNRSFPIRTKWLAAGLLLFFFWGYEAFDLWASPWLTAWVAVTYFLLAFIIDGFFKGASFCKYVCPIGQFHFIHALLSPFEIKVKKEDVCAKCTTLDCIKGQYQKGKLVQNGCELFLFQKEKKGNLDCTFCLDCVKACPKNNVGISTRAPFADLFYKGKRSGVGDINKRIDWAALAVVLVFAGFINAFGMVSPVYAFEQWLATLLGTTNELIVLAIIFIGGVIVLPTILLSLSGKITQALTQTKKSVKEIIIPYTYALVPLGFGMWVAHYLFHFLTGALAILPTLQEFLDDFGITVLNAFQWDDLAALVPHSWLPYIVNGFLTFGFLGTLYAVYKTSEMHYKEKMWAPFIIWGLLSLFLFMLTILLMAQPMEMRGVVLV